MVLDSTKPLLTFNEDSKNSGQSRHRKEYWDKKHKS